MELIEKYFKQLTDQQRKQFAQLQDLYNYWNAQINVISRKDMEHFYERHVLHSLGIAKVHTFKRGQSVLDVGTGGGLPGIPLAILFPATQFHLVDSIAKKIKVVEEVSLALGLTNLSAEQNRAEKVKGEYNFVVSRAVTQMPRFLNWTRTKVKKEPALAGELANGILYLKGGDLTKELKGIKHRSYSLPDYFEESFFETKKVIYVGVK
jgi:16S rRNA (guanine527-N7)-methyltransferase